VAFSPEIVEDFDALFIGQEAEMSQELEYPLEILAGGRP
jgi:hypothetical protein